jgi:hypothetical protein
LDALAIDSGLVDVNALFGLNLPGNERVKFRKRTTCGLLSLGNYVRVVKAVDHPLEFSEAICPGEGMAREDPLSIASLSPDADMCMVQRYSCIITPHNHSI